jgi:hypothetical protein
MATNTPNFNLIKPDFSDVVDITDINDNMDIIDAALATIPSGGGGIDSVFLLMGA